MFYKYSKWLINLSFWKAVFFFEILNEVVGQVFLFLARISNAGDVFAASYIESLYKDIFISIFIAPLLETLIAQWLPYIIIRYFTKNLYVLYFVSSVIFAVGHTYNFWYMATTFFIGLIFIGLFVLLSKKSLKKAYWGVVLVHAFSNTIGVILAHW
jgi:Type II CAAX prenyl endopeptidase Rce1-like